MSVGCSFFPLFFFSVSYMERMPIKLAAYSYKCIRMHTYELQTIFGVGCYIWRMSIKLAVYAYVLAYLSHGLIVVCQASAVFVVCQA